MTSTAAKRIDHPAGLKYPFANHPEPGEAREVAPGVRWVRMPLPFVLDHVNVWLLDDVDGLTIVDTGIGGVQSVHDLWEHLLSGPCAGRVIRRIIVTHCHPDHFGLARWLQERTGAPVWVTQGEFLLAYAWWGQLPGHNVDSMLRFFHKHGLDQDIMDRLAGRGPTYNKRVPTLPEEYERMLDGDTLAVGGNAWRVMVGHGHSPEHAALYCPALNALIAGDMILPRISTNISVLSTTPNADPLRMFLDSLSRYATALPRDTLVLPAHGRPFFGLATRAAALHAHHRERCAELLAAAETPKTAAQLLPVLFPRQLDAHQTIFAMGEAIAHLNYLCHAGKLTGVEGDDGIVHFSKRY